MKQKLNHYIGLWYGNGKGKFKRVHKLESPYDITLSSQNVVEMVSFDFDGDGDVDIISSHVGMYYSGFIQFGLTMVKVNGQLQLSDFNITLKP